SLYVWVDRFVLHGLAPETSLRLIVLAAAAFMPLSIGRLAARLDASPAVARLFALPLALSWPMRGGLVPYVLALPAAVLALAEGARLAEALSGAARAACQLALLLLLTYFAHPLAFALTSVVLGAGWLAAGRRRGFVLGLAALAPALL